MIAASITLEQFLRDYAHGRWLDPKTQQQMEISVRLLDRYAREIGKPSPVPLYDLSADYLINWMKWLAQTRSPKTVNNKRGDIMVLLREGNRRGHCGPAEEVRKMPEPERCPVAWRLPEIEAIFEQCNRLPGYWEDCRVSLAWKIGLLLFWDTGCRLEEVLLSEIRHLRSDMTLFVPAEHRKGKRADRVYPLHQQTWDVISTSLPTNRKKIFPFPCKRRQIWGYLKRILRAAGLPDDRAHMFHCLRRSAESYAAKEKGVQWAAEAIGHSSVIAKKYYISEDIAPRQRLIDAIPRPQVDARETLQLMLF